MQKGRPKNTPRPILQGYKDNIGRTAGNNKTKGANQSQAISNPLSGALSYRPQITISETACQLLYDRYPPGSAVPQYSAISYLVTIQQYPDGLTDLGHTENKIGIEGWTKSLLKSNRKTSI